MLIVEDVTFSYPSGEGHKPRIHILQGFDLRCEQQELVGLVGPSGTGKTTILEIIAGWLQPQEGQVTIDGLTAREAVAQQRVGLVQQGGECLFPHLSVRQNVALPLVIKRGVFGSYALDQDDRERVEWAMDAARISHAALLRPTELSGGMAARAMIARAIVHSPSAILFDEAFAALDEVVCELLYTELQQILLQTRATGVLVSHRLNEVLRLCTRVIVIRRDAANAPTRVVHVEHVPFARPRSADVLADPRFVEAYLRLKHHLGHESSDK